MKHLLPLLLFALVALPSFGQEALTLAEAVALAQSRNYEAQIARNDVHIAANNHTLGNAGFLPRLALSAGYNGTLANTRQEFISDQAAREITGALTQRRSAGATVSWTAFDGLGRFATYDRLGTLADQQRVVTAQTVEAVMADVIVAYYAIVQVQEQYRVFEEAVAISDERVRIAETRLDLGSASELEVRQARADRNADRAALLREETTLLNAKASFNQLLARPIDLDFVATDAIGLDAPLSLDALLADAAGGNRTLQVADQAIDIEALSRREIAAERLPQVNLNLGYQYSNLEAESGFLVSNRSFDFNYGLSLTYDVFDGFNRRRRLENADVRIRNAELQRENLRTQVETQIARLYQTFRNDLALIALEEENLTFSRQNVEIALERFRLGTITSVELREVQEQLTRAQSRLLLAQFDAKRTETELRRLAGRLEAR